MSYPFRIAATLLLLAGGVALGCRKPYLTEGQWQADQAKQLRPSTLDHGDQGWHALRTLRVRVYADKAFIRNEGAAQRYAAAVFERANQTLGPALRVRLQLEDTRELPPAAASPDLDTMLKALAELDPGKDVDFVLGLTGQALLTTLSFHDLGRSIVLGRHMVMRGMDDTGELRALQEAFDALSADERSELYQERKRHKETAVLLHEFGHAFGALHTRAADELMHPSYDHTMRAFAQENIGLMSLVLNERLAEAEQQDFEQLARLVETYLEQTPWPGWVEQERREFVANLQKFARAAAGNPPGAAVVAGPAATAANPVPELSELNEEERARYAEVDVLTKQERWPEAYSAMTELADRHEHSLALQQRACELSMRLGAGLKQLQRYCDRMTALMKAQPAP